MEVALVCLGIVAALQALSLICLCVTIPFLWWQMQKLRKDVDEVDETLVELLKAAGLREDGTAKQKQK